MAPNLSLYNQNTLSDDDFVANFVARHDVLKTLLRRLSAIEMDSQGNHQILIGPRGMGKTSLLRRVAIEINRKPNLAARFVPLSFREEQYNVLSLGDFWRNCGEALAEWAEATDQGDLASRLDAALPTKAWAGDDNSLEQFNAEMRNLNRRAVLLVDNLDLILDALSDNDQWVLRRHLQVHQAPIMIGAATQPLKESRNRDAAFYEFFQPHYLEPLDQHETETCMRALARRRSNHGEHVLEVLDKQPERLKTLHTLTGGNPRVLALIYRLLETAESDVAMADLEILLDQVTPYYKARIEEYQTSQQRAVIDAIALNWDPIKTGDLSRVTNIASTTLSPLLNKLRRDGLIENTETSGAYAGHQIVERFLNIWYLMRHGTRRTKQKMRWLVGFLTSFYSSHELAEISDRAKAKGLMKSWPASYAVAFEQALAYQAFGREEKDRSHFARPSPVTEGLVANNAGEMSKAVSDGRFIEMHELAEETLDLEDISDFASQEAAVDELSARFADTKEILLRKSVGAALINKGRSLSARGDHTAAIAAYDVVLSGIRDDDQAMLNELFARAFISKGIALTHLGDFSTAIAAYDAVVTRFVKVDDPALRTQVAWALSFQGDAFRQLKDDAAAIAAYEAVFTRFSEVDEPTLREPIAMTLFSKGLALDHVGDYAGAIATYDAILARFADTDEPVLHETVARALLGKGSALEQIGVYHEAIAAYDDALVRIADADDPVSREQISATLISKGIAFEKMGDHTAAIATYDAVVARFADSGEPALLGDLAIALVNKGRKLREIGDLDAAIVAYDAIIMRFADAVDPSLLEKVGTAFIKKGRILREIGDLDGAIAAYDAVVKRFADLKEPVLLEHVAQAMIHRAHALGETHDLKAAIVAYDAVVARFADVNEPRLLEQVAWALSIKAETLVQLGDYLAAIVAYDTVITRFDDSDESKFPHDPIAAALIGKGIALDQMGDHSAAITAYETVVIRFADAKSASLLEQVATALIHKGETLGEIGDKTGAVAAYDAVITRFSDTDIPALRLLVVKSFSAKGDILSQIGGIDAAVSNYQQALDLFDDNYVESASVIVARMRVRLANLLLDLQKEAAHAEALYKAAVATEPVLANVNLAWLYVLDGRISDARQVRESLEKIPAPGLALLDSAMELVQNNFGLATERLVAALDGELKIEEMDFTDDFDRLLRLAESKGYGERLLAWFEETAFADRFAPIYVAFKAYVGDEKLLLDVNPEVRGPASIIYDRLDAPRRYRRERAPQQGKSKSRRRPRKV